MYARNFFDTIEGVPSDFTTDLSRPGHGLAPLYFDFFQLKSELKILIKNEGQTEESRFLPKYCLAYYHSKQYK